MLLVNQCDQKYTIETLGQIQRSLRDKERTKEVRVELSQGANRWRIWAWRLMLRSQQLGGRQENCQELPYTQCDILFPKVKKPKCEIK